MQRDGAEYVIDEGVPGKERRGQVSSDGITVSPGSHTIKVYKRGYLPYSDAFEVERGKTVEIEATLTLYFGWVTVLTTPPGAEVVIDGNKKGVTPITVELPRGKHQILVKRQGFAASQREVKVLPGKTRELSLDLHALPKAPVATRKKWYKKAWVWTVIGVAVAGGVTAAVLLTRGGSNAPPTANAEATLSW